MKARLVVVTLDFDTGFNNVFALLILLVKWIKTVVPGGRVVGIAEKVGVIPAMESGTCGTEKRFMF